MDKALTKLDPQQIEKLRLLAKESLYFFAKGILGFDLLVPHIHLPICQLLQDKSKKRKRIILPRSWLKTTVATIARPMWEAIRDPNIRILVVQNSHSNACKKLSVIRNKFENCALFRVLFPEILPTKKCTWTMDSLCVNRTADHAESTFEAAGTRTKTTSRHYNLIIEDDTVAPDLDDMSEGALLPSEDDVQQAIGWHRLVLPLLVNPEDDEVDLVGTRWFEKDLMSWNKENEPSYYGYERACRETNGLADEDGELTYPERFPESTLKELAAATGPYVFSCLYMNKPIRSKDMIFQPEWFRYYEQTPKQIIAYTTVDLAGDPSIAKGDPDWNVVMTVGKDMTTGYLYVLEYFRARCSPSEVISAIFDHVRKYSPVKVGIEGVQYQSSLIGWVRERQRKDNLWFLVEPITHGRRSKATRIQGLQPFVQSGMIMFRQHHRLLVTELLAFPLAAYDDLSDALSMQLPLWAMTKSRQEIDAESKVDDPMSFDYAVKELDQRFKNRERRDHAYCNLRPVYETISPYTP